jgi:hypothetical protein
MEELLVTGGLCISIQLVLYFSENNLTAVTISIASSWLVEHNS